MNLRAWQFNKAKTVGIGRRVADIEAGVDGEDDKHESEHVGHID